MSVETFSGLLILMVFGTLCVMAITDNLPEKPEPPAITLHIEENVFGMLCKACPDE
jgi:hypothetical protein